MGISALCIPGLIMMALGALRARRNSLQRAFETAAPAGTESDVNRYMTMTGVVQMLTSLDIREPLLNQPCAWFSIRADKYLLFNTRHPPTFRPIGSKHSVAPFLLVNEMGSYLIDPESAKMFVPFKQEHWEGRYRAKMASISAGDLLTVMGEVRRLDPSMDGPVFELIGTSKAPLIVTTSTRVEIQQSIARDRAWAVALLLVGACLSMLTLLAGTTR
jgi:hypothetical protein